MKHTALFFLLFVNYSLAFSAPERDEAKKNIVAQSNESSQAPVPCKLYAEGDGHLLICGNRAGLFKKKTDLCAMLSALNFYPTQGVICTKKQKS